MADGLGFIFQRFYHSFVSGCIINIYVLCMLFIMGKAEFLYDRVTLFERVEFGSIFIFIFFALIIGIIIEGSTELPLKSGHR